MYDGDVFSWDATERDERRCVAITAGSGQRPPAAGTATATE